MKVWWMIDMMHCDIYYYKADHFGELLPRRRRAFDTYFSLEINYFFVDELPLFFLYFPNSYLATLYYSILSFSACNLLCSDASFHLLKKKSHLPPNAWWYLLKKLVPNPYQFLTIFSYCSSPESCFGPRVESLQISKPDTVCYRPTVLDGPVFRWDILHIWHWSHFFRHARRRRPRGSSYLHFPPDDQVHLPQVRQFRQHWKSRCSVHFAHQHSQWEDLRVPLVLVPGLGNPNSSGGLIPVSHYPLTPDESLSTFCPLPADQEGVHQCHHQENPDGWLVFALHVGTKCRLHDFQRTDSWTGQKTGIFIQRSHWFLVKTKESD